MVKALKKTELGRGLSKLLRENKETIKLSKSINEIDQDTVTIEFTKNEYSAFEQRLQEWQTQRQELEHQEQLFNAEKKSLTELYEHYKYQFEYLIK